MNVIKNTWGHFRKALYVIAFMLMIIPAYSFAFNKPYSHYSSQEDISSVLADFAQRRRFHARACAPRRLRGTGACAAI